MQHICLNEAIVNRVSKKRKLTLLNCLPNKEYGIFSYVWMAEGLIYHMTQENLRIIYAWVSTGHFCKGYEN